MRFGLRYKPKDRLANAIAACNCPVKASAACIGGDRNMSIGTIWDAVAGIALAIAEKIPRVIRTDQYGASSGPFRSHWPERLELDASGTTLAAALEWEIDRLNRVAAATLRTL